MAKLNEKQLRLALMTILETGDDLDLLVTSEMVDSGYLSEAVDYIRFHDKPMTASEIYEAACIRAFQDVMEPQGFDLQSLDIDSNGLGCNVTYAGEDKDTELFSKLKEEFCDKTGVWIDTD
jgi:hypothetical protein